MTTLNLMLALQQHLDALDPLFAVVHENTNGQPPADGSAYMADYFMPAQPDNTIAGTSAFIEVGIYQVSLFYPLGVGPGAALAKAEAVRNHFKRGTTLSLGGDTLTITSTPQIAQGRDDGYSRWLIPVTIRWQAVVEVV